MSLPVDLEVRGRSVLVCGGHPAGLATVTELLAEGAIVTVAAHEVATSLQDLASRGSLTWVDREATDADLAGAALIVAATGTEAGDALVRARAAQSGRVVVAAGAVPVTAAVSPVPEHPAPAGRVVLVGGGPGDPGLITVAGLDAVRRADVVVCDRLAPLAVLRHTRPGAEIVDVAKIPRGAATPQDQINAVLVDRARRGRLVVRLKGGDSFVFGRGGEEWQACAAAGLAVELIPGVSAALAAPALAGIPMTHRDLTQGFTVVSGHLPPGNPGCTLDWAALARANTTLVILMGVATLPAITAALLSYGLDPSTPAATVANAGMPGQREVRATLADIAAVTGGAGIGPPAVTVIGAVAGFVPSDHPRREES